MGIEKELIYEKNKNIIHKMYARRKEEMFSSTDDEIIRKAQRDRYRCERALINFLRGCLFYKQAEKAEEYVNAFTKKDRTVLEYWIKRFYFRGFKDGLNTNNRGVDVVERARLEAEEIN